VAYQHVWTAEFASAVAHLGFYAWVGWRFRPAADNPYTRLTQQEEIEMGL
jgi:hypothetical protein